jgi:hypothetical protein
MSGFMAIDRLADLLREAARAEIMPRFRLRKRGKRWASSTAICRDGAP